MNGCSVRLNQLNPTSQNLRNDYCFKIHLCKAGKNHHINEFHSSNRLRVKTMSFFCKVFFAGGVNHLPRMPILNSSSSAANKDMMAKIWTNGDTIT